MEMMTMIPIIIGSILWITVLFSFILLLPVLVMIYFFADNPKGVITKLMTYEFWIVGVGALVVSIGMFLNEILAVIGLADFDQSFDFDLLRGIIIALFIGGAILSSVPRKFKNTIFDITQAETKDTNKDYGEYTAHTLFSILAGITGFVKIGFFAFILNYLLTFIIKGEFTTQMDFIDFIIPFGTILVPLVIVGGFIGLVMYKKIPFIRNVPNPFCHAIRSVIAFFAVILVAVAIGMLTGHVLDSLLSEYGNWDLDFIRSSIVLLIVSLGTFGAATMHSPCARFVCNKLCKCDETTCNISKD